MIKDELEKEVKDLWWNDNNCSGALPTEKIYDCGYLARAEPREERIVELESTNKKISDECHKLVDSLEKKQNENELLETQNIKLQAEVSRLTIKNSELKELIKNIIRVTWGEGWNYSLDWKVKAEQFLKSSKVVK